jgi:hypothetical protein
VYDVVGGFNILAAALKNQPKLLLDRDKGRNYALPVVANILSFPTLKNNCWAKLDS